MAKAKRKISSLGTVGNFFKIACSGSLLRVLNHAFDHPMKTEEQAAMPLAGGIMHHGYQCGMIWGATLAAGAQAYRLFGPGSQAETKSIIAAQSLVESYRTRKNDTNCLDITGLDKSSSTLQMYIYFFIKGGAIGCTRTATRYAQEAFSEINTTLSEEHIEAPSLPVSCAAILAEKMGVSDKHKVMAAGLAGGIGLCGGACGALGAAIWITAMKCLEESAADNIWQSEEFQSRATDTIERFMQSAGHEFDCSEIVGRNFENIKDHATYWDDGGCSEIIEALATQSSFA